MEIPADGSVVRCDRVGSFPWSVLHDRHPVLLRQVFDGHPYPPGVLAALEKLIASTQEPRWYSLPFLEAEAEFYALLLATVGYDGPDAWAGIDPFAPVKAAELHSEAASLELAALEELAARPDDEQLDALLLASLLGNRADLSFLLTSELLPTEDQLPGRRPLLVDSRPAVVAALTGGEVTVVADNAGRELLADLMLIDHLLRTGRAARVVLHVKPRPVFVSDAMLGDVLACLTRLATSGGSAARVAGRLDAALRSGTLTVRTDPFWVSPLPFSELPPALEGELSSSTLVIFKGDLNYRRLVGDRHWPATTPFAECVSYLPVPVAALRTCKSEVAVGISESTLATLDGDAWRTSGDYGLIQTSL